MVFGWGMLVVFHWFVVLGNVFHTNAQRAYSFIIREGRKAFSKVMTWEKGLAESVYTNFKASPRPSPRERVPEGAKYFHEY